MILRRKMPALIFMVIALSTGANAAPVPVDHSPATISSLLNRGDESFKKRSLPEQAQLALQEYVAATQKSDNKDAESLWRVAMASYFVGLRLTHDDSQKEKFFEQGRDAGLKATALKPDCAECHFWAAVNMALYGNSVGVFKMLSSVQEIEKHLEKAIKLDPKYANGGGYRVLGLILEKLPGILGGSNSRARECFEKAIAIAPDEPLNYQFLARLLHDDLREKKDALKIAQAGAAIAVTDPDRIESVEAHETLSEWVKNWK